MKMRFTTFLAILALATFQLSCNRIHEETVPGVAPIESVKIERYSSIGWITVPNQEVRIQVRNDSDVSSLIDMRLFGGFQPELSDQAIEAQFGKPRQTYTDNFGGTWSRYPTPLGYVQIGFDRRTSPTDNEKEPILGRRSLQAYTEKLPIEVFHPALLDVLRQAEKMASGAEERELHVFDSANELVLDVWIKKGRIDKVELFRRVDK